MMPMIRSVVATLPRSAPCDVLVRSSKPARGPFPAAKSGRACTIRRLDPCRLCFRANIALENEAPGSHLATGGFSSSGWQSTVRREHG
jgi:hypothetical protein